MQHISNAVPGYKSRLFGRWGWRLERGDQRLVASDVFTNL